MTLIDECAVVEFGWQSCTKLPYTPQIDNNVSSPWRWIEEAGINARPKQGLSSQSRQPENRTDASALHQPFPLHRSALSNRDCWSLRARPVSTSQLQVELSFLRSASRLSCWLEPNMQQHRLLISVLLKHCNGHKETLPVKEAKLYRTLLHHEYDNCECMCLSKLNVQSMKHSHHALI